MEQLDVKLKDLIRRTNLLNELVEQTWKWLGAKEARFAWNKNILIMEKFINLVGQKLWTGGTNMEITWNKNSLRGTKDLNTWIRCFELNIEITWNKNSYCMEQDRIRGKNILQWWNKCFELVTLMYCVDQKDFFSWNKFIELVEQKPWTNMTYYVAVK